MTWWQRWRARMDRRGAQQAEARAEQEHKLRQASRETPKYERLGEVLRDLPPDEFAARVRNALTRRPT